MAIIVEGGSKEDGGGGWEGRSDCGEQEEEEAEVEEAEETLQVSDSCPPGLSGWCDWPQICSHLECSLRASR